MTHTFLQALPLRCKHCGTVVEAQASAICEECIGPLEPAYDPQRERPDRCTIAGRSPSMWRYQEWLPFIGEPRHSKEVGFTPLICTRPTPGIRCSGRTIFCSMRS